jgi:hypothetical protein
MHIQRVDATVLHPSKRTPLKYHPALPIQILNTERGKAGNLPCPAPKLFVPVLDLESSSSSSSGNRCQYSTHISFFYQSNK